jgi:hypothetical protein
MHRVFFHGDDFFVDNQLMGTLSGDGRANNPVYVLVALDVTKPFARGVNEGVPLARFKYGTAKRSRAKAWVKTVFEQLDVAEVKDKLKVTSPAELVELLGGTF